MIVSAEDTGGCISGAVEMALSAWRIAMRKCVAVRYRVVRGYQLKREIGNIGGCSSPLLRQIKIQLVEKSPSFDKAISKKNGD